MKMGIPSCSMVEMPICWKNKTATRLLSLEIQIVPLGR